MKQRITRIKCELIMVEDEPFFTNEPKPTEVLENEIKEALMIDDVKVTEVMRLEGETYDEHSGCFQQLEI